MKRFLSLILALLLCLSLTAPLSRRETRTLPRRRT